MFSKLKLGRDRGILKKITGRKFRSDTTRLNCYEAFLALMDEVLRTVIAKVGALSLALRFYRYFYAQASIKCFAAYNSAIFPNSEFPKRTFFSPGPVHPREEDGATN